MRARPGWSQPLRPAVFFDYLLASLREKLATFYQGLGSRRILNSSRLVRKIADARSLSVACARPGGRARK
jgi:hypothetical protein